MNVAESRKLTIEIALSEIDEEMRFCRALRKTLSGLEQPLTRELIPQDALKKAALSEGINGYERMEKFLEWADDQINNAIVGNLEAAWKVAYAKGPGKEIDEYNSLLKQTKSGSDEPVGDEQLEAMYDERTELEE